MSTDRPDEAPAPRSSGRADPEPDDLDPGEPEAEGAGDGEAAPAPTGSGRKVAIAIAAVVLAAAALFAYRSVQRQKALDEGLPKAADLLRLDTAAGYKGAADLLLPLGGLDPIEAGSMRAFAMAMLAADYRDPDGRLVAEGLLVEPGRADLVPAFADLATAALYLGRRAVGDAGTYASRAGRSPWSGLLQGRIAFAAGNLAAGAEPLAAATEADPRLAGALALQGDLARRLRGDQAAARTAYQAALAVSKLHPRAAYGLGKLALAGKIPLGEAREPLARLAADAPATLAPERARAALYLAAIDLRGGDRGAARADLDAVKDPGSRAWADLAAATLAVERGTYHAVTGAPALYQSAHDDDPPDLSPAPPAAPPAAAHLLAAKAAAKKGAIAPSGGKAAPPRKTVVAKKPVAPAKKAAVPARKQPRRAH